MNYAKAKEIDTNELSLKTNFALKIDQSNQWKLYPQKIKMPFSEATKQRIREQANYTCCWCKKPEHKVEIHHIIPEAEEELDTEDNAAPLCSNCHTEYGDNPKLRKEIKGRRDNWYRTCDIKREFNWPEGLHIPLLNNFEVIPDSVEETTSGTKLIEKPRFQITDKSEDNQVSTIFMSVCIMPPRAISLFPKELIVRAEIPFGLLLNIIIHVKDEHEEAKLLRTLRNETDFSILFGPSNPENALAPAYQPRNYLTIYRTKSGENRLIIGTNTATGALIVIRARLTDEVSFALADYLEEDFSARNGS